VRYHFTRFAALLAVAVMALVAFAPAASADHHETGASGETVVEVPRTWPLLPDGVGPGESFRLLFATEGRRNAMATDIATYNAFVREDAAGGHPSIRPYADHFRVLGSTAEVDARTNTATDPDHDGPGQPIYWLNGPKIADDYADFYDGVWRHADPGRLSDGSVFAFGPYLHVYTGTKNDGTASWLPLGGEKVGPYMNATIARPGGKAPIGSTAALNVTSPSRFYGLSGVFRVEDVTLIEVGLEGMLTGQLTAADGGDDWYRFEASAGEQYIVEVKRPMAVDERGNLYLVSGTLIDPSLLRLVDSDDRELLGERDGNGFSLNFARAFFTVPAAGTYYLAVGAGSQDRSALGSYTISVRRDDHADDMGTDAAVVLRPDGSLTACIDSDVAPDDPRLHWWDWLTSPFEEGVSDIDGLRPRRGIESLDDRDVFRFEIPEAGSYRLVIVDDHAGATGIWNVWEAGGNLEAEPGDGFAQSLLHHYTPGTYYVEVGTPYLSSGNTGLYTVSLDPEPGSEECDFSVDSDCHLEGGDASEEVTP